MSARYQDNKISAIIESAAGERACIKKGQETPLVRCGGKEIPISLEADSFSFETQTSKIYEVSLTP